MQIQLSAPQIWIASEAVDFRMQANGLSELVIKEFKRGLGKHIYVFYNRRKDKLKLLAHHRNGLLMLYKRLDKKKFTLKEPVTPLYEVTEQQLAWLLAGLDWITMSYEEEGTYDDYY